MHPPKTNCSQFLVSLLKYHLGMAALHGPCEDGNLHLSGSSTVDDDDEYAVAARTIEETVYRMLKVCDRSVKRKG